MIRRGGLWRWRVALLFGVGGSFSGCLPEDCDHETAPEGTRFQVEVLEELPNSEGCHLFAVEPGDTFFVAAGPTEKTGGGEDGPTCPITMLASPPEGVENEFEYVGECDGGLCRIRLPNLCPDVADAGYVNFGYLGSDLLDAKPSEARLDITSRVSDDCVQDSPICFDQYRIRISRATED